MIALWIEAVLKITLLVAVAAIATAALSRRGSAASRHLALTVAVAGLLLFPAVSAFVPSWTIGIPVPAPSRIDTPARSIEAETLPAALPSEPTVADNTTAATRAPAAIAGGASWSMAPVLFAAVVVLLLGRLVVERWRVRRLRDGSVPVTDASWLRLVGECAGAIGLRRRVALLRGGERGMPMAVGILRPAVVIPAVADTWDVDRRRAVVLHELAHVARHDCLTQLLAEIACAVYWPHPGVWWMARRLRVERELACDDRVLAAGAHPGDYAGHLLELAYSLGGHRAPALAVAMARPRQLEGRMLAVLDTARRRTTPTRRSVAAGAIAAALLLVPLAGATATFVPSQQPAGTPAIAETTRPNPAAGAIAHHTLAGTWDLRVSPDGQRVQLRLNESESSSYGLTNSIDQAEAAKLLRALSPALQPGGAGNGQFRIERDAGTLVFDGTFRAGVGAGTYTFEPSAGFPAELIKRGFARPTTADQYVLARANVGLAFIDALATQGYTRPDLPQLINAAERGVGLEYIRQMGQMGYRLGQLDALVRLSGHGVSPWFIRDLGAEGLSRLSVDDLVRVRQHGISPEYVRGLRSFGYSDMSLDTLVDARSHGISPEYVRSLQQFGYRLTHDDLVAARQHGVSVEYVGEMRQLGYQLTMADLIRARQHGVAPEYVREMKAEGYDRVSLDALIRLRQAGVEASYVQELKKIGYEDLTVDRVIAFRQEGVTATRPPMLKEAAWAGWVHSFIRRWMQ